MSRHVVAIALLAALGGVFGAIAYLLLERPAAETVIPELALSDLDGNEHRLEDYRGELVLVNFWATWCPPCLREIPMLVEAQKALGERGLRILGPALDDPRPVQRFAEAHGMNYPIFAGVNQIGPALAVMGDTQGALPYTVLLDREGRIVEKHYGELDRAALDALLEPYWRQN